MRLHRATPLPCPPGQWGWLHLILDGARCQAFVNDSVHKDTVSATDYWLSRAAEVPDPAATLLQLAALIGGRGGSPQPLPESEELITILEDFLEHKINEEQAAARLSDG